MFLCVMCTNDQLTTTTRCSLCYVYKWPTDCYVYKWPTDHYHRMFLVLCVQMTNWPLPQDVPCVMCTNDQLTTTTGCSLCYVYRGWYSLYWHWPLPQDVLVCYVYKWPTDHYHKMFLVLCVQMANWPLPQDVLWVMCTNGQVLLLRSQVFCFNVHQLFEVLVYLCGPSQWAEGIGTECSKL